MRKSIPLMFVLCRNERKGKNNRPLQRGQALIVVALVMVVLIGMAGLVIDGGRAFLDRRNAQNAADAAALAGAYVRIKGNGDWVAASVASAAENGYDNDGVTNVVAVYSPPSDGPYVGNLEYMQVIITSHINTYFAKVIGRDQLTNTVEATARTKLPEVKELLDGHAVISLAPTSDCNHKKAFWLHGHTTLNIIGGGVFVNSNNPTCAFIQENSGSIRLSEGYSINMVAGASAQIQHPQWLTPAVPILANPYPYPPPFLMPNIGCGSKEAAVSEDGTTMSPGKWNHEFPPEGVTRLQAGVYCLHDGITIKHDIEGHNVLFDVEDGNVRFDKEPTIILEAPSTGDNAGLLLFLPMKNNSKVVLNGGVGSQIRGTILAPASPVLINGNDSSYGYRSQIIGYTIEVDGESNVNIVYKDELNFDAMDMPEVQLSQ